MRILIASVGYQNLRDLSVGPVLVPALRQLSWPPDVEIDDLSFGPIAVVQRFQDQQEAGAGHPYDRIVFVAAVVRNREPGRIYRYRWDGALPDDAEVQQRIGEAVTGVISLDNLLIIAERFGALPRDVIVVEVEPEDTGWGPGFTPRVEAALPEVIETVRRAALDGTRR